MNHTGTLTLTTPTDREIVLTRVFDAPRRMVFDALTKPELLERWFGARGWNLRACEVDLRVGGTWRFVSRGPDGTDMGHGGVYRVILPPDRLAYTELFDDQSYPGESLITHELVEQDGKTTLTSTSVFDSVQDRDGMLESGMEGGAAETYDRLDEYLEVLKGRAAD